MEELRNMILSVEKKARPRQFVQNQRTSKMHNVLTYFSEVGIDAVAYCGYKYGQFRVRLTDDLGGAKRDDMCKTCLAEQRAIAQP